MPVTALDPRSALIVIDLQKGLAAMVPAATFAPVVAKSRALADAFRARRLPVVLVTADGTAPGRAEQSRSLGNLPPGFAEVVDEMAPQASDILVRKQTWGVFASTDLEARLKGMGVTQVVVTGVATSAGVESTARLAYEAGFNVTIPVDAVADLRAEAHERGLALIFPRLGETGST
ncbi:cysteine hydrolase, partial [Phenylobacterium sp.]|uniref:cysteine hydrolase family protein n=1 Tax=Phenylobacterium sp. TaxID=1871053 RepID=UPI002F41243F